MFLAVYAYAAVCTVYMYILNAVRWIFTKCAAVKHFGTEMNALDTKYAVNTFTVILQHLQNGCVCGVSASLLQVQVE